MFYMKPGTRVLTGNMGIPNSLIRDYVVTLYLSTTEEDKNKFVDISLSQEQLEGLIAACIQYVNYTNKYPVVDTRDLHKEFFDAVDIV